MASVLITGAGGFLGTELTRVFCEAGHAVRAGDLAGADLSAHEALGAEPCECDVTDPESVRGAVGEVEIVVNGAGIFDLEADPKMLWKVNAGGSQLAAEIAAERGVKRFVQVSSTSVYGRGQTDAREDAPRRPEHEYDRSKWAGEEQSAAVCEERGVPWVSVRPTLIYGPRGRYGLARAIAFFHLVGRRGPGKLPIAPGGPPGHHVHVADVARATELVATDDRASGAYNVADDSPILSGDLMRVLAEGSGATILDQGIPWSWAQQARGAFVPVFRRLFELSNPLVVRKWGELADELGFEPELSPRVDTDWLEYLFQDHSFDCGKLRGLGFEFRHPDPRGGIAETVRWYRDNHWLPPM